MSKRKNTSDACQVRRAIELRRIEERRKKLHSELDDFHNVTRARRIRINIELDHLAAKERRLYEQ